MEENTSFTLSLLYPEGANKTSQLSRQSIEALGADKLITLTSSYLSDYYTNDIDTIKYRQELFADLENNPEITEILRRMLPYLSDILDLRRIGSSNELGESYLYEITEIEIYSSLMNYLHDELLPLSSKVNSTALKALCERIETLTESEYYYDLTKQLEDLSSRVRDIRSITIGINLDQKLEVESSGVISINSEKFRSGKLFDRVKRLDFKTDEMTYMAELIPFSKSQSENQRLSMKNAVNNAISDVFKSSVSSWKNAIKGYVLSNTDFLLEIAPEVEFISKAFEFIQELKTKNVNLVNPELSDGKIFNALELINPAIALATDNEMVPNDISFDNGTTIFVITGPNRGGKSVFTCAIGLAYLMTGLGLPVAAKSCTISPADKILTHFPSGNEDTVEKGRLGEECSRLCNLLDEVTANSIVLLDESLSSTGSFEGSFIAAEILEGLAMIGCLGIFSTHLHDLAASVQKINDSTSGGSGKIENLVAEVIDISKRSFKIVRKTPDGRSYASDIAEKYGLSHSEIAKKVEKKQNNPCNC